MSYQVIGKSPARADAWEKVRGRPIYAADFSLPGMLHSRIVRSPYSSARIARIDVEAGAGAAGGRRGAHARRTCRGTRCGWSCLAAWRRRRPGRCSRTSPCSHRTACAFTARPSWPSPPRRRRSRPQAAELVVIDYEDLPGVWDPGDGAPARGAARARGRQRPAALASAQGRRRPRVSPGRRGRGADVPDAVRGSRLHRDRDGHRMDRRRGRAGPPGEHAGARALPRRGRRAPAAAQPRAARGRVSRRRLRRQGGRDGRVPARPARVEDAAPRAPSSSRAKNRSSATASATRTCCATGRAPRRTASWSRSRPS